MTPRRSLLWLLVSALLAGCGGPKVKDDQTVDRLIAASSALADSGRQHEALDSAVAALEAARARGNEIRLADAERLLGDLESAGAQFDKSVGHYTSALQRYREQADRPGARSVAVALALLHHAMGQTEEAADGLQEAYRLAGAINDLEGKRVYGRALLPLARALRRDDVADRVRAELSRAADSSRDRGTQSWLKREQALAALQAGDASAAVRGFVEAFGLSEQAGDSLGSITILGLLACSYERADNTTEEMNTFTEALQRADRLSTGREIREQLLLRVGNAMLRGRQSSEAQRFFEAALASARERGDRIAQVYALLQLSHAQRGMNAGLALALAREALSLLAPAAPPGVLAYAQGTAAMAATALNTPADALELYQKAADASERALRERDPGDVYRECESAVVGDIPLPWHDECIDLLLRLNKTEEAFAVALRRDIASVQRAFGDSRLHGTNDSANAAIDRWAIARARLRGSEVALEHALSSPAGAGELVPALREALGIARETERLRAGEVLAAFPAVAPIVAPKVPSRAALQQTLPGGTALVLYAATPRALTMFVLTPTALGVPVVVADRAKLIAACRTYGEHLRALGESLDSLPAPAVQSADRVLMTEGQALFEQLLRPLDRLLAGVKEVWLIPSDVLPFVPLHTLRRGQSAGTSLIERFPVTWVHASLLPGPPPEAMPVHDVVAFGHPGTTLRDADYELRDARAFFKEPRMHTGNNVRWQDLVAEHGDFLHLGLEIRWDSRRPANAAVVFPDGAVGVLKPLPLCDFLKAPVFPAVLLYNYGAAEGAGATSIPVPLLANGARTVVQNGVGSGRKVNKVFGEAWYTALQNGVAPREAYRSSILSILRRKESCTPNYADFVLWGR